MRSLPVSRCVRLPTRLLESQLAVRPRPGIPSHLERRAPWTDTDPTGPAESGSWAADVRRSTAPIARTGSSSEALGAARRELLRRSVGLVTGCFLLYALASCFVPALLTSTVSSGFQVGELAALAQVLVIGVGVWSHDRRARRYVDPLAQVLTQREREGHIGEFASDGSQGADSQAASFNAFDSFRAFGERATP